jgi:hypothetical protein
MSCSASISARRRGIDVEAVIWEACDIMTPHPQAPLRDPGVIDDIALPPPRGFASNRSAAAG